jgi:hypothetical protein
MYTNTSMATSARQEVGDLAVIAPDAADEITASCRLLSELARDEPGLVGGPMARRSQHWIAVGRPASHDELPRPDELPAPDEMPAPSGVPGPARSRFVDAHAAASIAPSTKPFDLGLYTSTATRRGRSMWRTYLDMFRGSNLYPLPWYTWELSAGDIPVLEIVSAHEWARFVETYHRPSGGLIYPDWQAVATDYDAVHLSLSALVAIQGLNFPTARGLTAATFWDVESTLWLRWRFSSMRLLDVTDDGPARPSAPAAYLPRPPSRHDPSRHDPTRPGSTRAGGTAPDD